MRLVELSAFCSELTRLPRSYGIIGITLFISILSPIIAIVVSAKNGLPMAPVYFLIGCAACLVRSLSLLPSSRSF